MRIHKEKKLFYLFLHLIASNDNHVIPELLSILDTNDFLKLVDVYGGKYIRIPSADELKISLKTVMYDYKVNTLGEDPEKVCKQCQIDGYSRRWIIQRLKVYSEYFEKQGYEIPENFKDSKIIKEICDKL